MLRELHISNLAVISDARIELSPGLNCFTGVTGAGKSLVIGAIEILLGLRSPTDMLRKGADEGRVAGIFEIADPSTRKRIESATDIPLASDEILLTRRLFSSGRSSVSLNGQPITLPMLKLAAEQLVDVHGQHDHQYLLKPAHQLDVLDAFANAVPLRDRYETAWHDLATTRDRLAHLATNQTLRQQQLDLYRFQATEIDAATLAPGEQTLLQTRAKRLANAQRLRNDVGSALSALDDSDQSTAASLVQQSKSVAHSLAQLAELDPALQNIARSISDAAVGLQEAAFDLTRYLDRLDLDPQELAAANDRLTLIGKLAQKYTPRHHPRVPKPAITSSAPQDDVDLILAYREQIRAEIASLEQATEDLSDLAARLVPLESLARSLAQDLSSARSRAATKLARQVERALSELGMERATLSVVVQPQSDLSPSGQDAVEFLASTNPGQDPAPLRKIASGGELSRIMLALKGILSANDRVSVLVFDEIDANVGGRLGSVIGTKLRQLATGHQVLCITHLPQIAAYADRHLTVRKTQSSVATSSTVRHISGDEQIAEIAEMIGGHFITPTTLAQARELLQAANVPPSSIPPATAPHPQPQPAPRSPLPRLQPRPRISKSRARA